ncbi:hypothetical protein [Synechococcus sp. M16CYN]
MAQVPILGSADDHESRRDANAEALKLRLIGLFKGYAFRQIFG